MPAMRRLLRSDPARHSSNSYDPARATAGRSGTAAASAVVTVRRLAQHYRLNSAPTVGACTAIFGNYQTDQKREHV